LILHPKIVGQMFQGKMQDSGIDIALPRSFLPARRIPKRGEA
jgi:hypothetical protein